jgi:hypothetical protein
MLLLLLVFSSPVVSTSYAQLGEVAGHLNFAVQVGHSQTITWTLLNVGSNLTTVSIAPPGLQLTSNSQTANQPVPTVTFSPNTVTIQPHSSAVINVTVFMPLNETPYFASWEGIISAQVVSNATNPGGAQIQEGIAKIFSIGAIPSTTTSTTTIATTALVSQASLPSISLTPMELYGIGGIVVLVIIVVIAYMIGKRAGGKAAPAKRATRAKATSSRKKRAKKGKKGKAGKGAARKKARKRRAR